MFGFGKKKPAPQPCPNNPGRAAEFKVALAGDWGSRTESINGVGLLAAAVRKHGHRVKDRKTWLEHEETGYAFLPQLVDLVPLDDGGVRTVSTVQVNHPALVPEGAFEYQHSAGNTAAISIESGFENWVLGDFPVLLDAARPKPSGCTRLEMEFPAKDGTPARKRRVILGPVAHFRQHPPADKTEEHPFCPCCMFTSTAEAFKELLEESRFCGLRFYAARDENGMPQADCRINGEDWEQGAEALREYAATWPEAGFEFRRQYAVLVSVP